MVALCVIKYKKMSYYCRTKKIIELYMQKNRRFLTKKAVFLVRVSLKDLWKSSNINGLQAASKAFIL